MTPTARDDERTRVSGTWATCCLRMKRWHVGRREDGIVIARAHAAACAEQRVIQRDKDDDDEDDDDRNCQGGGGNRRRLRGHIAARWRRRRDYELPTCVKSKLFHRRNGTIKYGGGGTRTGRIFLLHGKKSCILLRLFGVYYFLIQCCFVSKIISFLEQINNVYFIFFEVNWCRHKKHEHLSMHLRWAAPITTHNSFTNYYRNETGSTYQSNVTNP